MRGILRVKVNSGEEKVKKKIISPSCANIINFF